MYFEFPAILNCRHWILMMQYSISIVKTHWWQNCKYVSNKVTDINLIKMHIHVGYINDFWWVRKPNHLHVCSDSKSKEILQGLIFFALKSTEKHKAIIRIVKTILDNSRKTFLNKVFQKIFSSLRKLTDSHFECKYFLVNLVHSSKYFVLVLFTLSWMKRVTASLEFITVHSCLVTKSKILESELLNQTIIIVKNAAVKIDKLRLFY